MDRFPRAALEPPEKQHGRNNPSGRETYRGIEILRGSEFLNRLAEQPRTDGP